MGLLSLFGWKLWNRLRAAEPAASFDPAMNATNNAVRAATQANRMTHTAERARFNHRIEAFEQIVSIPARFVALLNQALHSLLVRPAVHLAAVSSSISLAHFRIGQTMREAF